MTSNKKIFILIISKIVFKLLNNANKMCLITFFNKKVSNVIQWITAFLLHLITKLGIVWHTLAWWLHGDAPWQIRGGFVEQQVSLEQHNKVWPKA
jgi:hypothetical protein